MNNIVLCAHGRDVKSINLTKRFGSTNLDEDENRFTYALYVSSEYLDKNVDTYRQEIAIPDGEDCEGSTRNLFHSVTLKDIEDEATKAARRFLADYVKRADNKKQEMVEKLIKEEPALRAIPKRCPEIYEQIDTNSSPEKIIEALYKLKGKSDLELRKQSNKILQNKSPNWSDVEATITELTHQLEDTQKDALASYICRRRVILALLEKRLEMTAKGKFEKEEVIHNIIYPVKKTSDEVDSDSQNLWLIDELLAFHTFAASDLPLSKSTKSKSNERPDIITFAEQNDEKMARSISLIEIKKPQRKDPNDPCEQLYGYVRQIRSDKTLKLPNGRTIEVMDETRFYCYAICDLTPAIHVYAENGNFSKLLGERGYYTYNSRLNTHTEILAFDQIITDAKRRHKVLFDKLGIAETDIIQPKPTPPTSPLADLRSSTPSE